MYIGGAELATTMQKQLNKHVVLVSDWSQRPGGLNRYSVWVVIIQPTSQRHTTWADPLAVSTSRLTYTLQAFFQ